MRAISNFFGIMTGAAFSALITIALGAPTVTHIGLYWTGVEVGIFTIVEFMALSFIAGNIYDFCYDEEDYNRKVAKALAREEMEKAIRKVIAEECK